MKIVGIICEYNPLHNGHASQIRRIRDLYGEECAIVCLMSGNFVQRGHPAVYHKMVRAQAAVWKFWAVSVTSCASAPNPAMPTA